MKKITAILLILAMIFSMSACGTAEPVNVRLQLLATSDMHGKFMPYDYALNAESTGGSVAQLAAAVDELRNENTVVIDGGDVIQGNSSELFFDEDIHPMILAMNEIGYDICIPGNHEFNYGIDTLKKVISQNKACFLCGNVYDPDGKALAEKYTVIEKSGVKIGFIGMVTPNIARWDSVNLKNWTVTDPVEETKKIISELRDKVDVLVAVEHMMMENELEVPDSGIEDLANACPELDMIIAAHGHQKIDDLTVNGVPIIENTNDAGSLGQILIDLEKNGDKWTVSSVSTALIDVSAYDVKAELSEKLAPYHEKAVENAEKVIGTMESDYLSAPNEIAQIPRQQIEDTAVMDLINQVQMYYTGAAVSGTAMFDANSNLQRGNIRNCDVSVIYKFTNTLYKLEMTGAQLKKWMEWSACYYNTYMDGDLTISFDQDIRAYSYDMFAGVNYEIDISQKPGERIKNLTWPDGTPVKDDDVFIVAANNYRCNSQLTSYGSIFSEGEKLPKILEIDVCGNIGGVRELIKDYIVNVKGGKLTAETDNNWKIIGNNWDEALHEEAVRQINEGVIEIPFSADGRTPNVKSVTTADVA